MRRQSPRAKAVPQQVDFVGPKLMMGVVRGYTSCTSRVAHPAAFAGGPPRRERFTTACHARCRTRARRQGRVCPSCTRNNISSVFAMVLLYLWSGCDHPTICVCPCVCACGPILSSLSVSLPCIISEAPNLGCVHHTWAAAEHVTSETRRRVVASSIFLCEDGAANDAVARQKPHVVDGERGQDAAPRAGMTDKTQSNVPPEGSEKLADRPVGMVLPGSRSERRIGRAALLTLGPVRAPPVQVLVPHCSTERREHQAGLQYHIRATNS